MEGTSSVIPAAGSFDAVFMTSHVAQAISDGDSWRRTLRDVRRALRPGGLLAFADGAHDVRSETLAFRTEAVLRANLATAGFETERMYGGWHREPVGGGVGEFVVLARALSTP